MTDSKDLQQRRQEKRDHLRAKSLRQTSPLAERLLWHDLRQISGNLSLKFRRQHAIHPYVVDFACVTCHLVIEIDGMSHDSRPAHDAARTRYLENLGYTVMRFSNEDVYSNREGVVREIVHKAQELFQALPKPRP